jgi:hypothetical protein
MVSAFAQISNRAFSPLLKTPYNKSYSLTICLNLTVCTFLLAAIGSYVGSEWDLFNMSCSCGVNGSITFYLFEVVANVVHPRDFVFLSLPSASAVSCSW